MSDRTDQTLTNLAFEVTAIANDQLRFYKRLYEVAPHLVNAGDIQVLEQRLSRMRSLYKACRGKQEKIDALATARGCKSRRKHWRASYGSFLKGYCNQP